MTGSSSQSREPPKPKNGDAVVSAHPGDRTVDHEEAPSTEDHKNHSPNPRRPVHGTGLITQAVQWLHDEKNKRTLRRTTAEHDNETRHGTSKAGPHKSKHHDEPAVKEDGALPPKEETSAHPDGSDVVGKPEPNLGQNSTLEAKDPRPMSNRMLRGKSSRLFRRTSSHSHLLHRTSSFDSDYFGEEVLVPSCDVYLDNTKTLSNEDGGSEATITSTPNAEAGKNLKGWSIFKHEVLRLAVTLRLKGWKRVPLDRGNDITVERLSGALTNAVYVVNPPKNLEVDGTVSTPPRKPPPNLLLRIYGPQVEHLIDRESELQILRRLARKNIGPRLLGTFINGRFEEYFHARTLTPRDVRNPDISRQIAKRMRELHDGIDLLEEERDGGPTVWKNWDKWVERAAQVVSWTDQEIITSGANNHRASGLSSWRNRGLVCGVEWPRFRQAVEKYRAWLVQTLGGLDTIKKEMTQYGNILRLEPSGESPLLLPANEHKRLIVIDFEYASANSPGLEFANHFTEWCYNYHDPHRPYALTETHYPTPEEQRRFLRSYIEHITLSSSSGGGSGSTHPTPIPLTLSNPNGPSSRSTPSFHLDSRSSGPQVAEDERRREYRRDEEVDRLMHETRVWRAANSAQWIAWGVVQAIIPEMDQEMPEEQEGEKKSREGGDDDDGKKKQEEEEGGGGGGGGDDGGFDYLGYAQERAMFFWGDLIGLGIVAEDELPRELLEKVKCVER
ncbi:MAG: hypothetical protein M1816_003944 [Peltula sp. TS41687]|nr:MAG: hypothetical protein M1816_003944 [Peltula sp. TS41687]